MCLSGPGMLLILIMHEQYPQPAEGSQREIIQPPDVLIEASMVPAIGEAVSISNQTAQIHLFENRGASYIEIYDKISRRRIFTEDVLTLEVLSGIGCLTVAYASWSESHEFHPSEVIVGDNWEIFDSKGEISFTDEVRQYGRVISRPDSPDRSAMSLTLVQETPVIPLDTSSGTLQLRYSNTQVFKYNSDSRMNHILVSTEDKNGNRTNIRLYDMDEFAQTLIDEGFTFTTSTYPGVEVVRSYLSYLAFTFDDSAENLLMPRPATDEETD